MPPFTAWAFVFFFFFWLFVCQVGEGVGGLSDLTTPTAGVFFFFHLPFF